MKLLNIALMAASALMPFAAQATDLPSKKQAPSFNAQKPFLSGAFQLGGAYASYVNENESDEISSSKLGVYGSAFANAAISDQLSWGINLQGDFFSEDLEGDNWYERSPGFAAAVGSNIVARQGNFEFGAFAAYGGTNHVDSDGTGYQVGGLLGFNFNQNTMLFSQLGYSDIRVDFEDSGFTGWFVNGGIVHAVNNDLAIVLQGGYGYAADNYEDASANRRGIKQPGEFWNGGAKGIWKISDKNPIYLNVGYDYAHFDAIDDKDIGEEHTVKVGVSVAFGGANTAKSTFNPYATSLEPYRAAAWAEVLD